VGASDRPSANYGERSKHWLAGEWIWPVERIPPSLLGAKSHVGYVRYGGLVDGTFRRGMGEARSGEKGKSSTLESDTTHVRRTLIAVR